MTERGPDYTWMPRPARRISSSSVARVAMPRVAPCVLDLLGRARPQAQPDPRSVIG
jgi:hypothetical protein